MIDSDTFDMLFKFVNFKISFDFKHGQWYMALSNAEKFMLSLIFSFI